MMQFISLSSQQPLHSSIQHRQFEKVLIRVKLRLEP